MKYFLISLMLLMGLNADAGKKDGRFGYADTMWNGCAIVDVFNVDEYGKITVEPARKYFKRVFEYEN